MREENEVDAIYDRRRREAIDITPRPNKQPVEGSGTAEVLTEKAIGPVPFPTTTSEADTISPVGSVNENSDAGLPLN